MYVRSSDTMRVAPKIGNHSIIGRALADRTVEARDPSLINLPLPLPSIPVLSPVLSPLLGGSNQNQNSGTTSSSSPAPAPSQTTTAPSNGNGGDQGNNGGGNSGDNGGGNGNNDNNGNSGSGGGSTGNSGGNSGNGGGSGGSSTGGGSSGGDNSGSDQGGSSGSAPSTTTAGNPTSGNQDTPSSNGSTPNGTNTGNSPSGTTLSSSGPGTASTESQSGGESGSGSGALASSGAGAANAAAIPTGTNGSAGTTSGSQTISGHGSAGTHSVSGSGTGSTGSGNSASGAGNTDGGSVPGSETGAASKHGISGGAIAGIVICLLLLLLCAFVFLVRKRRKARRDERANIWWFTRKRNSQTYGDRFSKEIMPSNRSVRSSFATTVDRSGTPRPASFQDIPPLPPMAEVGRSNGAAPKLVIEPSAFYPTLNDGQNDHRFSIGSGQSGDAQYLMVHHRDSVNPESPGTPMSVRPFSPSESFAFPKPPDPVGDRNSAYSRPSSGGTFAVRNSLRSIQLPSSPTSIPPTPALPGTAAVMMSPINKVIDPFADNNPFEDPVAAPPSTGSAGEFAEIEFIRRPFYPTLPDEVAVRPDDPVRIIQAFDDGWALIEKVRMDQPMGSDNVKGLIPIDCLREPGQDLPSFYAAKRVSSYAGSEAGFNAI